MPRHLLAFLLLLLGISACAAPPPPLGATARVDDAGRLLLRISAPAPLQDAELTAPDGRAFPARRIVAPSLRAPDDYRPGVFVGGSGGSSSGIDTGIGISLPVRNPFGTPASRGYVSEAEFALPAEALARYKADAAAWFLSIAFGNERRELKAPPVGAN